MNKKSTNWRFPQDLAALLSFELLIPIIALGTGCLFPLLGFIHTAAGALLFWVALGTGTLGIILLYFARLPLYRQHRFWTFGPRELPSLNRKLYWLAYLLIVASILLFAAIWTRF